VRFGRATRLTGFHPRSELWVYSELASATPHFSWLGLDLAPIEKSNPISFKAFMCFVDNRPDRPKHLVLACQSPRLNPSAVT
jgi:hypothetical protein